MAFRFHNVNLDYKRVGLSPKIFLKELALSCPGMTENELPTLYQFDLQYRIEARAVGLLNKSVFYLEHFIKRNLLTKK